MTNDRWHVIEPDGTVLSKPTPSEFYRSDRPGAREEYEQAWRDYGEALVHSGMRVDTPSEWPKFDAENEMV